MSSLTQRLLRHNGDVIALAVLLSPVIPLWLIRHSDRINKDGIWHIAMAEHIAAGDWSAAMDLLAWPLYPAILAAIASITGSHFEVAGYVWNVIAYGIVTFAFLSILRELGGDRRVLLFGVACLFLHPALNSTLPGLFRDQGYWAFYLLSILLFLRFYREPGWLTAGGWWVAMAGAMLFRVEGVVFLALLPLILLARPGDAWPRRLALVGQAHCLSALCLLVAIVVIAATNFNVLEWGRLAELEGRSGRVWSHLTAGVSQRADVLSDGLLNEYSSHQAYGAVWAVMGYILVASSLAAVNWLYLGLAVVAGAMKRPPRPDTLRVLLWLVALNVIILTVFVINEMYLSFRYGAGLGFLVMVFASFGMAALYEQFLERFGKPLRENWAFFVAVIALGIVGGDGLYSTGARKTHEVEAGRWIRDHIGPDAPVFFDQARTVYYAERPFYIRKDMDWPQILAALEDDQWRQYEFIVITPGNDDENVDLVQSLLGCEPHVSFHNNRGSRALIYRTADCRGVGD